MLLRHWLLRHLFFFNDTATTEIYTLSLHDALPIFALWKQDPQHQEKLFILGTGTEQPNLEALSKSLSLESEIKFLGQKQNPYPYMKQAKLFLHASLQEGFGLVLVEAMACGTPVIAKIGR